MSLETLLEAAEYIESARWRPPSETRGEESTHDFPIYTRTSSVEDNGDSSLDSSHGQGFFGDENRDKRRYGGAGTREVHNKLEKNRRAHLKECFEILKKQIPFMEDKKTSNLSILRGSLKYIQNLKRKEKEYELELQRLAQEKSRLRDRIATLKMELAEMHIEVDLMQWMQHQEQETNSTSTATACGSPIMSETEDNEEEESPTFQRIAPKKAVVNSPVKKLPVGLLKNLAGTAGASPSSKSAPPITPAPVAPKPPPVRTPVTQILHNTLTQRQARQRQQALTASQGRPMAPLNMKQTISHLRTPPITSLAPMTTTTPVTPGFSQSGGQVGKVLATSMNMPIQKTLGPRIVTIATSRTNSPVPNAGSTSNAILNHLNSTKMTLPSTLSSPAVTSVQSIKPVFATAPLPGAQLMSGPLTFNPNITTGPLPKSTGQVLTTGNMSMLSSGQTQIPGMLSIAHMGLNNMTVMSPGLQVANLVPNNVDNVITQQALLKQILFQPHILPQGQVLGTPVVKPVVVVSMPSVATTTTPPTTS